MKKLQIDYNLTKQVRIDTGYHKMLAQLRAELGVSMRSLIEDALINTYAIDKNGKPYVIKGIKN